MRNEYEEAYRFMRFVGSMIIIGSFALGVLAGAVFI